MNTENKTLNPIVSIFADIDDTYGKATGLKIDLATKLVEESEGENIAKETERLIEKAKTLISNEYTIEHMTDVMVRNMWLDIKSMVRLQLAAKIEPDMKVEVGEGKKKEIVTAKEALERGSIRAAKQAGKSINENLGISDGRSGNSRAPRTSTQPEQPKAPTVDTYSVEAWERKITGMANSENKQLGREFITALLNKWDFVQDIARKQGYTMTLLPMEKETTAKKANVKKAAKPKQYKTRLVSMPKVDAIQHPPAKGKKHQPQPITH